MQQYLMGIDIGTSQTKGVLTDLRGNILASAFADHDTQEVQPGYFEHDADGVWIHDSKQVIRKLKEASGISAEQIKAVCMSAIGPCVLPVDQNGKPLCNAILYGIDTRACEEIQELNSKFGEDYFVNHCGNALSTQAAGPKIAWLRKHKPDVFRNAAYFMTATSYLVFRLTGTVVMDYYTACAGYTPLFDYEHMCWDAAMCEEIGCLGRLPELRWTAETAGTVTKKAAEEFGLCEGTFVCVGTCDAAAEAVSVGVVAPSQTMLMMGSTAFLISLLDKPARSSQLWSAPFLFPDTYALLGGMGSAGSLTKWFLREFSESVRQEAERTGRNPYALLAEKAETVPPGCDGLTVLPYFCGERTPINDPKAKGVFFGLQLRHKQEHLYRALLESVAFGIRDNLETMERCGNRIQSCFAVGGGTRNAAWMQIISDVTGCRQVIQETTIGASYGDAFLSGICSGLIEDRQTIRNWVHRKEVLEPREEYRRLYDEKFAEYRALYHSLRDLMHHPAN